MRRAYIVVALLTGALGVACGGEIDPVGPDGSAGGDGGADVDAELPSTGLALHFSTDPVFPPGDVGGVWNATIASARLTLTDIRVIGDGAVPELAEQELRWEDSPRETAIFADATPGGRYQTVMAKLDKYKIEGTVEVDDTTEDFVIDVGENADIAIDLGSVLIESGRLTEADVTVRLGALIDVVDWSNVDSEDGTLTVEEEGIAVDALENALESSSDPIFVSP